MFAIIQTGGKQYKVSKGDKIEINKIESNEGDKVTFEEVLLIGENGKSKIGTPTVAGAKVEAKVLANKKGDKIRVFKMKPKKRYQRTYGHRSHLTEVEITSISA